MIILKPSIHCKPLITSSAATLYLQDGTRNWTCLQSNCRHQAVDVRVSPYSLLQTSCSSGKKQSRCCWFFCLFFCCCFFLFSLLLNVPFHTLVYFRDGSAQTILRAATLRQKLQIKAFHLTQSQYTDTGPTSPRADPITPSAWQGSHWNANV